MSSVDAQVDQLESALRSYVELKSGFGDCVKQERMLMTVFSEFDQDHSGFLDEDEFEAALVQRVNIVGCKTAIAELFDRYDEDVSGQISYGEFVAAVLGTNTVETKETDNKDASKATNSRRKMDSSTSAEVIATVKSKLLSRAGTNAGIRTFSRILRTMDKDGSRSLSPLEVLQGMETFGVMLTKKQLAQIMQYFDRDNSGKISIEEFLRGLRGKMSRSRKRLVRMAWEQLVRALRMDGPNDSIQVANLKNYYDVSKHPEVVRGTMSEEEALQAFMRSWDRNGDFEVTWLEFLEYYRDISAGIDHDDHFELMIRNAWHLSGGQGWAENTSNRRVLVTFRDGRQQVVELVDDFALSKSPTQAQVMEKLASNPDMILCMNDVAEVSLTA